MPSYEARLTAGPEHIDELGHVNNAVWVEWIQQVAVAHWRAAAPADYVDSHVWVVIRHEIDYLRSLLPGDSVTARTWVGDAPQGARFDRHMEFTGDDGKIRVRARTQWAMLDKTNGRPQRVPAEVVAAFSA
ncbi:MAG: acyl-CoA thioesterase [Sphingomonadales bacterium]|nr:acyl-CoA thioesterase [Sphingomonadales bacterium]